MINLSKMGEVYIEDTIICNRPGIVIECVKEHDSYVCVNNTIQNVYTMSYATQGTLVSFFSAPRKLLNKATMEQAWFIDFERAYFLCTLNDVNGEHLFLGKTTMNNILLSKGSESDFQDLNHDFAYTFLVTHNFNLRLIYIWDIVSQKYVPPTSSEWKIPKFCDCDSGEYVIKKNGTIGELTENQMTRPLFDHMGDKSVKVVTGKPLLISIYCGDKIYPVRVLTKTDMNNNKLLNSTPSKFHSLLLAKFKTDDRFEFSLNDFIKQHFTKEEFIDFEKRVALGFERFKFEIYSKTVLRNWICFPDKLYNTIRLGDIIDSNLTYEEKVQKAFEEVKKCTKGWRKKALFEFYNVYCN